MQRLCLNPYRVATNTLLQLKQDNIHLYNRHSNIFDKEGKSDKVYNY